MSQSYNNKINYECCTLFPKESYKMVRNFKFSKLYIHFEVQMKNPKEKKNSTYTKRYIIKIVNPKQMSDWLKIKNSIIHAK